MTIIQLTASRLIIIRGGNDDDTSPAMSELFAYQARERANAMASLPPPTPDNLLPSPSLTQLANIACIGMSGAATAGALAGLGGAVAGPIGALAGGVLGESGGAAAGAVICPQLINMATRH